MRYGWIFLVGCGGSAEPRVPEAAEVAENKDSPEPSALPGPGQAEVVAHLAGCWQANGDPADTWLVAYTHPIGGVVLGTTRQFRGEAMLFDEVERFAVGADGLFGMTPIAEGAPRARFVLDSMQSTPGNAVFVNPENDWPKAIRYRREGDRLDVIAEGGDRALGLALRPAACR